MSKFEWVGPHTLLAVWCAYAHTMHLTIPNLMAAALLWVVLETEMFTLNFFCRLKHFYDLTLQQELNLTNLKHMTIKNERCIKDLFTDNSFKWPGDKTHVNVHMIKTTGHLWEFRKILKSFLILPLTEERG